MEIKEIGMWQRGPKDWNAGLILYHKYSKIYGENLTLNQLIKTTNPTPFIVKKLDAFFEKIQQQVREKSAPKPKSIPQKYNYGDIDVTGWPQVLQNKRKKAKECFSLNDQYKGQLRAIIYNPNGSIKKKYDKKAAHELARKAVLNAKYAEKLWEQLRAYKDSGQLTEDSGESDNPTINYLFNLADENSIIKDLLYKYGNSKVFYNRTRSRNSVKQPALLKEADDFMEEAELIKKTYEFRYK